MPKTTAATASGRKWVTSRAKPLNPIVEQVEPTSISQDDSSYNIYRRPKDIPIYWTKLDGNDEDVGELTVQGLDNPREMWKMRSEVNVFISHTGKDGTKEDIARPTRWFLVTKLGVQAFIDEDNLLPGETTSEALLQRAYECTHALCILSPQYRKRTFCVQELNTFMKRRDRGDGISVLPALWGIGDVAGYCSELDSIIWINNTKDRGQVDYLTRTLWPKLSKVFNKRSMSPNALKDCVVEYVNAVQEEKSVPETIVAFAKDRQKHQAFRKKYAWATAILLFLLVAILVAAISLGLYFGRKEQDPHEVKSGSSKPDNSKSNETSENPGCQNDESCTGSFICLDPSQQCCMECRRILLTAVQTAGDGLAGGNVEPAFYINGAQVFPVGGGFGSLPANENVGFDTDSLPQIGGVCPGSKLAFRVIEDDDSSSNDDTTIELLNDEWYKAHERGWYSGSTGVRDDWKFFFAVETECCERESCNLI